MSLSFANGAQFAQCDICHAVMHATSTGVCQNCLTADQKLFDEARKKINFAQSLNFAELCDKTGLPGKTIQRWINAGRFRVH